MPLDTMEKMTSVGCCGWFGFSFAKKSNKVRGLGDSTSRKFLLDEETEDEDDSFSNRDVADNQNGEDCDFQSPTKRAEENLRYRIRHGFICREFPVKETHSLLRLEVERYKECNCKKSGCLKRYCECFLAKILCFDKCKCMDCKNFDGSEERKALFHGFPAANSVAVIQQMTNAAINGAIGTSPSKKSKNQRMILGVTPNDQLTSRL